MPARNPSASDQPGLCGPGRARAYKSLRDAGMEPAAAAAAAATGLPGA